MGQKRPAPEGVVAGSPSDCVALNATGLARVPDPRCAEGAFYPERLLQTASRRPTLLAEKLPATITVGQSHLIWLYGSTHKRSPPRFRFHFHQQAA